MRFYHLVILSASLLTGSLAHAGNDGRQALNVVKKRVNAPSGKMPKLPGNIRLAPGDSVGRGITVATTRKDGLETHRTFESRYDEASDTNHVYLSSTISEQKGGTTVERGIFGERTIAKSSALADGRLGVSIVDKGRPGQKGKGRTVMNAIYDAKTGEVRFTSQGSTKLGVLKPGLGQAELYRALQDNLNNSRFFELKNADPVSVK